MIFTPKSVQAQIDRIDYQRQRALADMAEAKATGDSGSGAKAVQTLADLTVARENVLRLHQGYVASQNPPAPSRKRIRSAFKPAERMDYNDVARMMSKSKYGYDDAKFREGIAEAARRRPEVNSDVE